MRKLFSIFKKPSTRDPSFYIKHKKTLFVRDIEDRLLFKKRRKINVPGKKIFHLLASVFQKKLFMFISLAGLVIFIVAILLLSPFFRIKNILISKQDVLTNIEQAYETVEYIRGKNILLLDGKNLTERIINAQSSLENINIHIDFPDTLLIELQSYPAIFQTLDYFILSNGSLKEKENKNLGDIPLISIVTSDPDIFLFGNKLNSIDIKNIKYLLDELNNQFPEFSYTNLLYYVTEKEVLLKNNEETIYIFDIDSDILEQINRLGLLKKEKSELYEKKHIYIDVRIPQKLFLCGGDSEFNCRRNIITTYGNEIFNLPETIVSG